MLLVILQNAPTWVWFLLAGLIVLGLSQARDRSMTLARAGIVPIVMVVLSFKGVSSVFGYQPLALLAWAKGLAIATSLMLVFRASLGISWSASEQRLRVAGSWWPLAVILAIFATKFAVGASVAMNPSLVGDTLFAALVGLAYGAFSGVFFGRAVAMWKVAHQALAARA
jgi:hypothetical protein